MLSIFFISVICWLHFIQLSTSETTPWIRSMQSDMGRSIAGRRKTSKSLDIFIKQQVRKNEIRRKVCDIIGCRNKTRDNGGSDLEKSQETFSEFKCPKEIPKNTASKSAPVCSELTDTTNDTHCMKFNIPDVYFKKGSELSGADVYVHIKLKKMKKKRRKRKITLKISRYNERSKEKNVIATLKFKPLQTNWYKISLPLSIIRKVDNLKSRSLILCIECKKCNKKIKVTFPIKTRRSKRRKSKKSKSKNKMYRKNKGKQNRSRKVRLHSKRPFLVCHTKQKGQSRPKRYKSCIKSCRVH